MTTRKKKKPGTCVGYGGCSCQEKPYPGYGRCLACLSLYRRCALLGSLGEIYRERQRLNKVGRERQLKKMNPQVKQTTVRRQLDRELYAFKRVAGLCAASGCYAKTLPGKSRCQTCLIALNARTRANKAMAREKARAERVASSS